MDDIEVGEMLVYHCYEIAMFDSPVCTNWVQKLEHSRAVFHDDLFRVITESTITITFAR